MSSSVHTLSARYSAAAYRGLAVLNAHTTQWLVDASPMTGNIAATDQSSPMVEDLEALAEIAIRVNSWLTSDAHPKTEVVNGLQAQWELAKGWAAQFPSRQEIPPLILDLRFAVEQ